MKILNKFFPILIISIFSLFSVLPLFNNGFFPMHDDTQVSRIFEMAKSIKLYNFPVRVVPDLGYGLGYPIFNYYAPLAYYIGSIFVLVGFNALLATKITIIIGMLLSGIFMYIFTKELFGKMAGLISSSLYILAPYHALDLYVRGDLAEIFAYALIPLVFWGLLKIYKSPNIFAFLIAALGYAGVILSHNLTAFMLTPFLLVCIFLLTIVFKSENRFKLFLNLVTSLILGIIISAFYWLPALMELNNTNVASIIVGGSDYKDHFACLSQLWSSPWGFAGSAKGCIDGLSLMIGKLHIIFTILTIILGLISVNKKFGIKDFSKIKVIFMLFFAFLTCAFLTLEPSRIIWDVVPVMKYFQFPWRFLLLTSFFTSVLAGAAIYLFAKIISNVFPLKNMKLITGIALLVILIFNFKFFTPQKLVQVNSDYYTNENELKWRVSKISDEYLPQNIKKPKSAQEALRNKQIIGFSQTPLEQFSNIVSLTGILALILAIIMRKLKYEKTS